MTILTLGTAVIDITAYPISDTSTWQEKQRISGIGIRVGGDGANQSIHLADLGLSVAFCGAIGNDANGTMLKSQLESRGVDTSLIPIKNGEATGTALVIVGEDGRRNTFSVKGAHSLLEAADLPVLSALNASERPQAITIASLFSLPVLEQNGLLEYLQEANKFGILVFADLGSDKQKQGLAGIERFLPYIDYFLPSLYDAQQMTGKETAEECAAVYQERGCRNVIIKCGAEGCYYLTPVESGWVPAINVDPIDTTGAGDCMVALFISRILKGEDIRESITFACGGASLSTLYMGASDQILTAEKIFEFIKQQANKTIK